MKPDEIEDLALAGAELPDGLNAAEQLLFLQFRYLYRYARLVGMPKEQGRKEKSRLLREFQKRSFDVRHMDKTRGMWQAIESAANRYGTERTLENADAFVEAVYGVKLKHDRI